MMRSLGIAATGMQAMQTQVEVISNNIANVNTTGFKRGLASFQDLLYQSTAQAGASSSETGTQFQKNYFLALQQSPDVVLLHSEVMRLLGR